jgi:L-2,4-diaminobutyrate decarboxylase
MAREKSWETILQKIRNGFLSGESFEYHRSMYNTLQTKLQERLFPAGSKGPAYLGDQRHTPDELEQQYRDGRLRKANLDVAEFEQVMDETLGLFQGMTNWNHPLTMPNVVPPPNLAASMAAMITNSFSPNIIEGEYSWGVANSELETAAMIADLIGWEQERAGGLFTFGGSGCYLYGLKYALTRVLGKASRHKGIRTDGKLLVSKHGHYCKMNSTDWTGLGMDNIIEIQSHPHTYAMDIGHLEEVLEDLSRQSIPVIAIICTMGSTDSFAVDPVRTVWELIQKYPNPHGYGRPFLYCDAVIGWSWLFFRYYDFVTNPLQFRAAILPIIKSNYEAMKDLYYADAIGCDFHKTGWTPYNSSIFMIKDYDEFSRLLSRPGSEYLQEHTSYNPGLYTLEVSRSGSYSLAAWATLKYFGCQGFQSMLGGVLEQKEKLKAKLDTKDDDLICIDPDSYGFVTLIRIYPRGMDADVQYAKELNYPDCLGDLMKHNRLQEKVADKLWAWYRSGKKIRIKFGLGDTERECYAPYISYTSGFRPTAYNQHEKDPNAVIYALKAFPMNLNIDEDSYDTLIGMLRRARDEVIHEGWLS